MKKLFYQSRLWLAMLLALVVVGLVACTQSGAESADTQETEVAEVEVIATNTPSPEPSETPTLEPTNTPTFEPTETFTPESTDTPEPTDTPTPEPTETEEPTATLVPTDVPTLTSTPVPASEEPAPTAAPADESAEGEEGEDGEEEEPEFLTIYYLSNPSEILGVFPVEEFDADALRTNMSNNQYALNTMKANLDGALAGDATACSNYVGAYNNILYSGVFYEPVPAGWENIDAVYFYSFVYALDRTRPAYLSCVDSGKVDEFNYSLALTTIEEALSVLNPAINEAYAK